jgi:hypothetical protein
MEAFQLQQQIYEEKLARMKAEAGVEIKGRNPGFNLDIIQSELQKECIHVLSRNSIDLNSVRLGTTGRTETDLVRNFSNGSYVRFLEQAFEWEHMTYVFYPYFWGRRSEWDDKVSFEDPDPLFMQFVKSGYARVQVPVRPPFEGSVDHFVQFGEPWMGGPLPTVSSPLYFPIAQEIATRKQHPESEYPVGNSWELRVPTTLVKLRQDESLPAWEKDPATGRWKSKL